MTDMGFPDIAGASDSRGDRMNDFMAPRPTRSVAKSVAGIAVGAIAVALVILGLRHLAADGRQPARQVTKIALLPDAPPPPPPPKIEKKEEIKQDKPQPREQEIKPKDVPQEAAPLKMEGEAGNGPSAFQAGTVTQDYQGGVPGAGTGASQASGIDRAQARLYANGVRQALHDELERQLGADISDLDAQVALWVANDGRISRWEMQGESPTQEVGLRNAMQRVSEVLQLPAPQAVPQPLRFRLSLRASG